MAKKESLIIRLIKFLPKTLQLSFIGIGCLQRYEIYKSKLPGMLPMLGTNGEQSTYLKQYLTENGLEKTESIFMDMEGQKLHALYHPSLNGKFICAFHGIKGNWLNNPPEASSNEDYNPNYRMLVLQEFAKDGFGFLAFSLPGFDPSEGSASEKNFKKACDVFADYTIQNIPIDKHNIIVWGESLGTALATIFAAMMTEKNYAPAVVSLVAPFDSMINMVRNKFQYFSEVQLAMHLSEKLDTKGTLPCLDKKQTFLHIVSANHDNIIPLENTLNLVYAARMLGFNVLYHPTSGDHTTWDTKEIINGKRITHIAREKNIEIAEKHSIADIEKLIS